MDFGVKQAGILLLTRRVNTGSSVFLINKIIRKKKRLPHKIAVNIKGNYTDKMPGA